jgi:23S rRNA pseudouridine2605 synthase
MMNLNKYISYCGAASRREAEARIRGGEVTVNGTVELNPAYRVMVNDAVALAGKVLLPPVQRHYVLLHKPRGYVCSNADVHAEHLAVELINIPGARLVSAGRLDKDSEGAIIFSDDGEFINFLAHPRYEVLKKYLVTANRPLTETELAAIRGGISDDGEFLQVRSVCPTGKRNEYEFILNEGKKREIRRLVAACGAKVTRLIRMEIGNVALGGLPVGKFRELSAGEIAGLWNGRGKK